MIDLSEQKFGRWTVLRYVGKTENSRTMLWLCECVCGVVCRVGGSNLKAGRSRSCVKCAVHRGPRPITGSPKKRAYRRWIAIRQRCYNPRYKQFRDYGGRGIIVAEEWLHDFSIFFQYIQTIDGWDRADRFLDRIDNDGNYEPGNIRFCDRKTNNLNRRTSAKYETKITELEDKITCLMHLLGKEGLWPN
jgi:hypothetical protein